MRLPKFSELSEEQLDVCQAPLDGTTIVIGPPGSGKTVVALFRRSTAEKLGAQTGVVVYNNVLQVYTGTGRTFYRWLAAWWRSITGVAYPTLESAPNSTWRQPDFGSMIGSLVNRYRDAALRRGHWGHLIIDEAQDFGREAHALLANVPTLVFGGLDTPDRPSITILADDNQRITSDNSTIADIVRLHQLTEEDVYRLRQNYRNTREIASVAALFFVGTTSGIPAQPERRGNKPSLVRTDDVDDAVARIASHARGHPEHEIGVLVQYTSMRKKLFNKLNHRLRNSGVRVQTFGSGDDANGLAFDTPGVVTVLTFASSKGLEFDAVFLPELQATDFSSGSADVARMTLYVMCSRAREALTLLVSDDGRRSGEIWRYLPNEPRLSQLFELS